MGNSRVDDLDQWKVRLGMLPDFPDSEVSRPLYQLEEWQREDLAEQIESVLVKREITTC